MDNTFAIQLDNNEETKVNAFLLLIGMLGPESNESGINRYDSFDIKVLGMKR